MRGAPGELLQDVVSSPAPLSHDSASRMVHGLRIASLLDGWRGNPPSDVAAVIDALVRLSWLAVDLGARLIDLEINPMIVGNVGAGVRAVDVRGGVGGGDNDKILGDRSHTRALGSHAKANAQSNCTPKLGHPPWRAKEC